MTKSHVNLSGEIVAEIVKHTDGVPLFLEEVEHARARHSPQNLAWALATSGCSP
jgi:hypothetical protein